MPMRVMPAWKFTVLSVGLPEDIARRKAWGDLEGAIRLIDRELRRQDLPEALRNCMTVEREIMCRIPEDYPLTRADALAEIRQHIPDFTEKEFDERVDAGKIGWVYLNGEMHFFNRFFSSMCKAEPAFAQRAGVMMHGVESVTPSACYANKLMPMHSTSGFMLPLWVSSNRDDH